MSCVQIYELYSPPLFVLSCRRLNTQNTHTFFFLSLFFSSFVPPPHDERKTTSLHYAPAPGALSLSLPLADGPSSSRRDFFTQGATAAVAVAGISVATNQKAQAYAVPDLPYPFEALEPVRCKFVYVCVCVLVFCCMCDVFLEW